MTFFAGMKRVRLALYFRPDKTFSRVCPLRPRGPPLPLTCPGPPPPPSSPGPPPPPCPPNRTRTGTRSPPGPRTGTRTTTRTRSRTENVSLYHLIWFLNFVDICLQISWIFFEWKGRSDYYQESSEHSMVTKLFFFYINNIQ